MKRNRYKATCDICRCQVKANQGQLFRIPGGWGVRHDACSPDMAPPTDMLSIDGNHFVAGVGLRDDAVTEAAPIVKYMLGWSRERVENYCLARSWRVTKVAVL